MGNSGENRYAMNSVMFNRRMNRRLEPVSFCFLHSFVCAVRLVRCTVCLGVLEDWNNSVKLLVMEMTKLTKSNAVGKLYMHMSLESICRVK
jgi:hypothetical protein